MYHIDLCSRQHSQINMVASTFSVSPYISLCISFESTLQFNSSNLISFHYVHFVLSTLFHVFNELLHNISGDWKILHGSSSCQKICFSGILTSSIVSYYNIMRMSTAGLIRWIILETICVMCKRIIVSIFPSLCIGCFITAYMAWRLGPSLQVLTLWGKCWTFLQRKRMVETSKIKSAILK